jgi:hypothetical protein
MIFLDRLFANYFGAAVVAEGGWLKAETSPKSLVFAAGGLTDD